MLAFLSQLKRNKQSESVTVVLHFSPKTSQVQQLPHTFWDTSVRFVLYITVFICTALHIVVSVYVFVALRCVPFCVPFLWSKSELLCSGWHNSSFIKNTKKRPLHKNVQRPLTIQAMLLNNAQEQAITEQPLLPRSA